MREMVKSLMGIAAAIVCLTAAVIFGPTAASAQNIGGIVNGLMRGGLPVPQYRPPARHPATASTSSSQSTSSSHKKDSDEEEEDSSSSKKSANKGPDKDTSADKGSSDKGSSGKNASASDTDKSRRQLSNDDTPPPSTPAKADPPKAEPVKASDDELSFSPSR